MLPQCHKNVFNYLAAFLRELLKNSASNRLDVSILGKKMKQVVPLVYKCVITPRALCNILLFDFFIAQCKPRDLCKYVLCTNLFHQIKVDCELKYSRKMNFS